MTRYAELCRVVGKRYDGLKVEVGSRIYIKQENPYFISLRHHWKDVENVHLLPFSPEISGKVVERIDFMCQGYPSSFVIYEDENRKRVVMILEQRSRLCSTT